MASGRAHIPGRGQLGPAPTSGSGRRGPGLPSPAPQRPGLPGLRTGLGQEPGRGCGAPGQPCRGGRLPELALGPLGGARGRPAGPGGWAGGAGRRARASPLASLGARRLGPGSPDRWESGWEDWAGRRGLGGGSGELAGGRDGPGGSAGAVPGLGDSQQTSPPLGVAGTPHPLLLDALPLRGDPGLSAGAQTRPHPAPCLSVPPPEGGTCRAGPLLVILCGWET